MQRARDSRACGKEVRNLEKQVADLKAWQEDANKASFLGIKKRREEGSGG